MTKSVTDALVGFSLDTKYQDIPPQVVHATKRVMLDTIGCTVAGFSTEIGQRLAHLKKTQGGRPESTLMVGGERLPCASVSYVHTQLSNSMDADETILHTSHFANCVLMPSLAVAERTGASGKEVLAAVALGFDVAARIGLAMPVYSISEGDVVGFVPVRGFSWAAFGTTAAVGRLLHLTRQQLAHAFGIAYQSTPLQCPWVFPPGVERPMSKYTMYGPIAEAGVNAALLAGQGFTGDYRILDPDHEFWKGMGALTFDWDFVLRALRQRWFITETSFKTYPVGRQANIPIDLFYKIVHEHGLTAGEIEQVIVRVPPSALIRHINQRSKTVSQVDAAFNLPYALSMAAAGVPPGPQWHHRENLTNAKCIAFMDKVRGEEVPEWFAVIVQQLKAEGFYRRVPTEVEIRARGKRFTAYAEYAQGDPWTPETTLSDDQLQAKFREFTRGLLTPEKAEKSMRAIFELESASSVGGLIANLH
ncbi:MAG: MmgE/PrpD family protein [Chloroflexi bacterium]|nr:MmgE/PrpD family protein [Chloroflexota bacterium]